MNILSKPCFSVFYRMKSRTSLAVLLLFQQLVSGSTFWWLKTTTNRYHSTQQLLFQLNRFKVDVQWLLFSAGGEIGSGSDGGEKKDGDTDQVKCGHTL